jgi:hypothetical protein
VICRGLSRGHRIVKLRRFGRKRWSTARPHTAATAFCHSRKRERSATPHRNGDVVFRFARDSPLEGDGFEPSVPQQLDHHYPLALDNVTTRQSGCRATEQDAVPPADSLKAGCRKILTGQGAVSWTNGGWRSTLHRVVNPPAATNDLSRRLSIGMFFIPNYDAVVARLRGSGRHRNIDQLRPPNYRTSRFASTASEAAAE